MVKILYGVTLISVSIAVVADIRLRKIPNWLTIPAILTGLILNGVFFGLTGVLVSLKGLGLGFGLLFFVYLLGGMGAGDVKLLSAVGALLGPRLVFYTFIWTALAGGLMAVIAIIARRALKQTFHNLKTLIQSWVLGVSSNEANFTIRNQSLIMLPYGVAIAIGTILAIWRQGIPKLDF